MPMNNVHVTVYGRLSGDPKVLPVRGDIPLTAAQLVTLIEERREGQTSETRFWLNLIAFGRQAEGLALHARHDTIRASGFLQLNHYVDRHGVEREQWQLRVDALHSARLVGPADEEPRTAAGEAADRGQEDGISPPEEAASVEMRPRRRRRLTEAT